MEASLQQESKTSLHLVVEWFCPIGNFVHKLGYTTSRFVKQGSPHSNQGKLRPVFGYRKFYANFRVNYVPFWKLGKTKPQKEDYGTERRQKGQKAEIGKFDVRCPYGKCKGNYHSRRYDKDISSTGVRLEFPHIVKFQTDSCRDCVSIIICYEST